MTSVRPFTRYAPASRKCARRAPRTPSRSVRQATRPPGQAPPPSAAAETCSSRQSAGNPAPGRGLPRSPKLATVSAGLSTVSAGIWGFSPNWQRSAVSRACVHPPPRRTGPVGARGATPEGREYARWARSRQLRGAAQAGVEGRGEGEGELRVDGPAVRDPTQSPGPDTPVGALLGGVRRSAARVAA